MLFQKRQHPLLGPSDNAREEPPQFGGHLQVTTFRPPHLGFQRRHQNDAQYLQPQPNVPFHQQQQYQQEQQRGFVAQQPQFVHQPRQLFPIVQQQSTQLVGQYQPSNAQAVPYQPLYDYQQRNFAADFPKPRNRFDFQPQYQQQNYVPFG